MKFMFCIPTLGGGGAERVVSVISNALVDLGHKVYIIVEERNKDEYQVDSRVEIDVFDQSSSKNKLRRKVDRINSKRKIFRKYKPDVIIPFLLTLSEECILAAKITRIPVVSTIRINPAVSPENKIHKKIRDILVGISDLCWVQTDSQKKYFKKSVQKKIFVLPNPISPEILDIKRLYPAKVRHFVSLGRLTNQKNFQLAIKAAYTLIIEFPDLRLDIYGSGPEKKSLKDLIKKLGMEDSIRIHERTHCVEDVYLQADAFILTSLYEGMPNALMEAMASGLPCISTNCPTGPKDVIDRPEENGILIPINDEKGLRRSMEEICNNPEKAKKMGQNAKKTIWRKYSPTAIANDLIRNCSTLVRDHNETS